MTFKEAYFSNAAPSTSKLYQISLWKFFEFFGTKSSTWRIVPNMVQLKWRRWDNGQVKEANF